jgi:UDP-glucose 4-epimerase
VDIKCFESLDKIFAKYKPTAVIHFAAYKAVGESVSKPLDYYHNNVSGTITLLRVMEKHNCNVFVFSSSACVYGENPLCTEDDKIQPLNPYGQTKAMIE